MAVELYFIFRSLVLQCSEHWVQASSLNGNKTIDAVVLLWELLTTCQLLGLNYASFLQKPSAS